MAGVIRNAALFPPLTGALLYALTAAPPSIRDPAVATLSRYLSPTNLARTITVLKWLFGVGLATRLNAFLTSFVHNNFRLSSKASSYDWPHEIIVITGAAGGFGALMASDFASHGLRVMALDVAPSMPAHLSSNPRIHYYKCDVTDPDTVARVAKTIIAEHGHPSVLINNAGIGGRGTITTIDPSLLRKVFEVNILSHYSTVRAFLPSMVARRKGHVVTIASMASFITSPTIVPYSNTKAAALSFHEGLTAELLSKEVHDCPDVLTTVVHPIWANTAILEGNAEELRRRGQVVLDPQEISDRVVKQVLSGKGGALVIAGGTEFIRTIRGWPGWARGLVYRLVS